jgi:hypothetical protein
MLFSFGISILLGHTEIHHVNDIGSLRCGTANEEVVGFDVAVDEVLFVDRLNTG